MPFRIRTKLVIAFLAIIIPYMVIAGIISFYNMNIIYKGVHKVEAVTGEMDKSYNLQLALDMALMPVNDYIITGEKRYVEGFQKASVEVERWLKELEGELAGLAGLFPAEVKEERGILKDAGASWQKIKEISAEIFAIRNPVSNSHAAALMEEMDYKWAYPAIERLRRWREIDEEEYRKAHEGSERALRRVVIVMIAGGVILLFFGGSFAVLYSRIFVRPIETIHDRADAIAKGDFKTRLDIRTGDELQQLSNAMNEMAAQLDSLYGTLERQVQERTGELQYEKDKLLKVFEGMEDGVYIVDQKYDIQYINPSLEKEYGPWKGIKCYTYFHDRTEVCPWCPNQRVFAGETVRWEWYSFKNGKTYDLLDTPLRQPDGSNWKLEIFRDITEKKKVEEVIKESTERYKRLIESVTDYIFTVEVEDGQAVKTTHGPGCVAITGYSSEEYEANPNLWLQMVHEGDRDAVIRQAEAVLSGKAEPLEHRIIHKDGRVRWIRSTSVPHCNDKGQMVAYDGLISDITERKKAEEAIERAKKEWEETFDAISDPLFIHDREFKVVRANMAYADAAGMKFKEFIGRPYYEVFPKMEGPFKMCLKALELQEEEEEEEEFSCPLTNRIFKVRFYPIKDVNGAYLYSIHILEDITEAKRAAKRIREEMEITSHLLMIAEATAHTTDVDRLMEQVMRCVHEIMGCDISLSNLWDTETKVFRPSQAFGLSHELIPLFKTESLDMKVGFVKEAMRKREPVIEKVSGQWPVVRGQQNLTTERRPPTTVFSWLPDINTLAVIPLIGKKGPLGLIVGVYTDASFMLRQAQHEREKAARPELVEGQSIFTERDMKIMQGIMHQVSVALEQASLYKESVEKGMELSHRIETIQVMHEIDRSILSTLESEEILETVTRMVARIIPCDRATVVLVDRERGGFVYAAGFGVTFVPKGAFVPFGDTNATEVIETARPQYVSNLVEEVKAPLPIEKGLINEGFLSHIMVPLTVKGEVEGLLNVGAKRASAYSPEDLSTLEKLAYQIGVALSNARLLSDLEELFLGTVKSLSSAIDAKSPWTAGHSERVTNYALDIAREMGLSSEDIKALELAGLLHDIGKIGTYDILLDKPGKLEPDEIEIVRLHPGKGAEILEPIRRFKNIIPAIKHHHEFYDGTGYPDRLKGEEIPLLARILAVADTYDAMKADRPYRSGRTMEFMIGELKRCSGTQFDPKVVEAFLTVIGEREEFKMAAS